MAVLLVSPDSRGRVTLGTKVAREAQYAVEVDSDGVITLTPSVVIAQSELDALTAIRPVLSPDEAFGSCGSAEAARAVQNNRASRSAGDWGTRISSRQALHDLMWGDAA